MVCMLILPRVRWDYIGVKDGESGVKDLYTVCAILHATGLTKHNMGVCIYDEVPRPQIHNRAANRPHGSLDISPHLLHERSQILQEIRRPFERGEMSSLS